MSGWKDWAVNEIVTADDFQGYVQNQVVQVYAGTAARSAALGSAVAEGMMSYLSDTDTLQYYSGNAWIDVSSPGDITAVTAGTALTGGGSSGDVTLDVNLAAISIPASQINNLGTNVATFLTTPTSANLAAALTNETGTGAVVFGTSPTIATPTLTLSTATSTTAGRLARTAGTLRLGDGSAALTFSDDTVNASTYVAKTNGAVTTAAIGSAVVRNITASTGTATGGSDGDVWLQYTP